MRGQTLQIKKAKTKLSERNRGFGGGVDSGAVAAQIAGCERGRKKQRGTWTGAKRSVEGHRQQRKAVPGGGSGGVNC